MVVSDTIPFKHFYISFAYHALHIYMVVKHRKRESAKYQFILQKMSSNWGWFDQSLEREKHFKKAQMTLHQSLKIWSTLWHISLPAGYCTSKSTEHHCKTLSSTRVSTECSVRESCLNQFSCKPPNQKTYYSKYYRQVYILSSINSASEACLLVFINLEY